MKDYTQSAHNIEIIDWNISRSNNIDHTRTVYDIPKLEDHVEGQPRLQDALSLHANATGPPQLWCREREERF